MTLLLLSGDRAPRAAVHEVLTSRPFVDGATQLAGRLDRTTDAVLTEAQGYLEEMASEERPLAVDLWARLARLLHSRAYDLRVDAAQIRQVRDLATRHPLVFLPSHRSNLDPYVMTSVTYDHDLPHNHVLGGINMAFWPIGPLGRRVGAVFIRRSFRDNEVYRFVLRRYLGFLVERRFNLEWYMEGGRSRTGKLLPPRLGLLNYLADAVEEMDLRDILVVPTSIVYDLLHEAVEMTSESPWRRQEDREPGLVAALRAHAARHARVGACAVRRAAPPRGRAARLRVHARGDRSVGEAAGTEQGGVRDLHPHQSGHGGHRARPRVVRAARRRRSGAHVRRGTPRPRSDPGVRPHAGHPDRRGSERPDHTRRGAADAGHPRRPRRGRSLRWRHRARLPDRPRARARGRLLPKRHDPLVRRPGHPGAGPAARAGR